MTQGLRSYLYSVNNGTFSDPVPIILQVQLHAGSNTISLGNPTGYAPDLDRIVVAPWIPAGVPHNNRFEGYRYSLSAPSFERSPLSPVGHRRERGAEEASFRRDEIR